nr:MAG TPA: hypothetical protein [Caudoviricetes sp.]
MDFGARIADAQGTKNASKAAFNNYQAQADQSKANGLWSKNSRRTRYKKRQ